MPVTLVAKDESDYPPDTISYDPSIRPQANFTEKLLVDYRWFDAHQIEPRFGQSSASLICSLHDC